MFDRIARRYDLVNTVLSAGTDGGWRRRAAKATGLKTGGSALDVACGSGKLTAQLARIAGPNGRVVGLDFSTQMLEVARSEHAGMEFLEGDALNLPYEDATFDASTIAFGLLMTVLSPQIGYLVSAIGVPEFLRVRATNRIAALLSATRTAIGQELRTVFELPQELPREMAALLAQMTEQ